MHKLLRYAKKCITLCGNYYVTRKLLRYVASHTFINNQKRHSPNDRAEIYRTLLLTTITTLMGGSME